MEQAHKYNQRHWPELLNSNPTLHLDSECRQHSFHVSFFEDTVYGFALKQMHYLEQKGRCWTGQTGVGILIGDLALNSLQTRIMFVILKSVLFCVAINEKTHTYM